VATSYYKIWNGSGWDDISFRTYTYDGNNNLTMRIDQFWNGSNWVNSMKYTYTYNGSSKLTKSLTQSWSGSTWGDVDQTLYTYDSDQNLVRELNQTWSGMAWLNVRVSLSSYDEDNFIAGESTKSFNVDGTLVIDGDSTSYYSHSVVATHDLFRENGNISVYPNPSEGKFTINCSTSISSLQVYNLLGERLYSDDKGTQQNQKEIDLTAFGQGIYIICISDGQFMYNRKVVIQ